MFNNSTQKKCWIFHSEEILENMRNEANQKFQSKILASGKVAPNDSLPFLEPHEEKVLRKYYEKRLLDFCSAFKPAMPKSVVGTASMYFKRFYLSNSLMEYHPRTIMLTSVYLACKVDEFNVSSSQFVANLWESPAAQEKALEQILEYELLLIQQLNFHLIIHNPFRPLEGFLIDLKARDSRLENPEVLRKTADEFLSREMMTDAGLLFPPSQIALAAIHFSASRVGINIDSYLMECLMLKDKKECLSKLVEAIRCIKTLVKKCDPPKLEDVNVLKQKLEHFHSLDLGVSTNSKKRKGYEEDGTISKKAKMEEEEWSDDDLIDAL
ncbi:cyclin-H [Hypanus sabinus]|uniref:cyclin-H n=1 Tax=Hypanus sabinus TaxID=79690 RepID=UPI0028C3B806|nr:cyclin-H [Hypanus sabinus]XP_059825338.1 cyclin-H [Hypanus sabinus]XP_059825339.1 cyclin-H [Hypanus sabinus]XP_059825340.1 cyclin-H [Hypanus sabinus]XP_059825341.1 cyclin-H [Hypanus sabinus]XP_059825342.1 cyclin-H [Hypanus sabinus]